MFACTTRRAALLCSAALISTTSAMAQDSLSDGVLDGVTDGVILLDEIVLKRSKRDIQTDTANSITVIEQEEIDDRQATTVAELIDSVPGVTLINGATPQGSGINIRGFGANSTFGSDQKVLIQVDGASVGSEELYRIGTQLFTDPALYKEVSVLRGLGGSFEYGSGAIGGVVRLETKDASDFTGGEVGFKFRQTLQGNTNGSGFASSSILAWQPTENFEVLGNFSYNSQENQKDGSGATIGNSEFNLPSYALKLRGYFGDDRSHSAEFSYSRTESSQRDVPYDSFATTAGFFGNVDRDFETTNAVFTYGYNPADNDLIDLEVQLSYADQKIDQAAVGGASALRDADHRYETTKLLVKNTSLFSTGQATHDMRYGVEISRRDRRDQTDASAPGGTDDRVAVFVVDDIDFGNGLTLTPGVRFEDQTLEGSGTANGKYDNSALMGGVSAQYQFASGWSILGSAGYTESMPILDDIGTAALRTQSEKARNYEIGASYANTGVFQDADSIAFKATVYRTDIWDITSYRNFTSPSIDSVELTGVELEARYALENGFYADLNANIQDGDATDAGGTTGDWRNSPADQLRLTLGKRFDRKWDISWEMVANASIDVTRPSGAQSESAGYVVHNLRATYRPQEGAFEGVEVRLGLENAFDKFYTQHLATRPAPGRTLKVSLAKTF
ncbi:TonB-dependent receptor [Shimia sp. R9_1]|uniref:TonB-dependent receptor domain-containing protein n=1 Tax=Shimia sp. R9_1 TaxID=2821111 RepID=UPI001ADCF603|nr:TonB-dependent receptor [Shimia sp. R9_1]MBO9409393.1 TonB-dependent receptor [Shimia sp. R9_1]